LAQSKLADRVAQIGRDIDSVESELSAFGPGGGRRGRRRGRPAGAAKGMGKRGRRARGGKKGGARKGGGKGQRVKGQDLASIIVKVLGRSTKPMGIADVAAAAKSAGYKSSSPKFVRIVGMRLSTDKRFKRAGYGEYTLASKA
jgi:hypothetical protein